MCDESHKSLNSCKFSITKRAELTVNFFFPIASFVNLHKMDSVFKIYENYLLTNEDDLSDESDVELSFEEDLFEKFLSKSNRSCYSLGNSVGNTSQFDVSAFCEDGRFSANVLNGHFNLDSEHHIPEDVVQKLQPMNEDSILELIVNLKSEIENNQATESAINDLSSKLNAELEKIRLYFNTVEDHFQKRMELVSKQNFKEKLGLESYKEYFAGLLDGGKQKVSEFNEMIRLLDTCKETIGNKSIVLSP